MMEGGGREGEAFPPTLLNKEKAAMKIIIVFIISIAASVVLAQGAPGAAPAPAGWVDHDGDGRHDTFRDQNGDGINDLNNQSYAHRYGWVDENGDGLNDFYCDADGDGVNDLETSFRDRDGDGRDDNVLDLDGDGRNDITGLAYGRGDLHGDKFGFVIDGAGWVDEDGDGFADHLTGSGRRGTEDKFIDSDGDGMADGCWFEDGGFQHHRARTGQGGGAGGGGGGGPQRGGGGGRWAPEFGSPL